MVNLNNYFSSCSCGSFGSIGTLCNSGKRRHWVSNKTPVYRLGYGGSRCHTNTAGVGARAHTCSYGEVHWKGRKRGTNVRAHEGVD